ncbi:CehA/McbA family metallohydrolase [Nocardioides massiliensis]|uniref:Polymerase/histidinol phosphatase N-terminal domain-containing protein n=1 Tax=Nocardioides massiliensis TaxID=1325935 RepID=A0ABT9NQK5_9ACTN|nr:CehA/McbA family metallohydrolase [Nocardioides massiliensis]MDP9822709.1 hypothetical protein [Nocardioides massiliensis]
MTDPCCAHVGLDGSPSHASAIGRRALLMAGAGVITTAAVATPAAAGPRVRRHRFTGRFTGVGTPDWHYLPVRVPRGVREIEVSYTHSPIDTGLGFSLNVVDLGVFDANGHTGTAAAAGFRGWSGGARKGFHISRRRATPGYLPGPIDPGVWHVVLGPVAIVPPGVAWTVTVTLHFGRPMRRFQPQPPPRRVPRTGPGWYRGDCHTHTVHSDGQETQPALARRALAAGLDFIGSTEHNTSSGSLTWGRHAPAGLLVLPGEEVTTRAGHWLALGLPAGSWIDWRHRPGQRGLAAATQRVRGLGGIAVAAHPFVPIPGTGWEFGHDYADMDAVEIWNGPWTADDEVAVTAWHAMLVTGRFVPVMGNSDTHGPGTPIGTPQTVVHARTLSVPAVVAGLRRGRSWIAESSTVDLSFTVRSGGRTVSCGQRLRATSGARVPVRLVVRGAPHCLVQVIGPLGPLAGAFTGAAGRAEVRVTVPAALVAFVRAEVRRLDGTPEVNPLAGVLGLAMVAMTNPIFLR